MRDELLGYYERELIFLRRMGADFARKYPKIAARLLLDEEFQGYIRRPCYLVFANRRK